MLQKQMTLAALVALFIAGNAGIASADISSAASDEGSSAAMEAEWAATPGNIVTSTVPPTRSHVYARHRTAVHKVKPESENGAMQQHG